MNLTFSQRQGITPVEQSLQMNSISRELKNALWSTIWTEFFEGNNFIYTSLNHSDFHDLAVSYWTDFLKEPIDVAPEDADDYIQGIRHEYFSSIWNRAFDLVEFLAEYSDVIGNPIYDKLNQTLDKERSGYRFVNKKLTPITSTHEMSSLEEVVSSDFGHNSVSKHIQRAIELYSDRTNPDFRNSIKESISAVEAMAKIVTGNPKATLSDALKALEKKEQLHKALKDGFEKLYAYTSDAHGIRHSMINEPNLTAEDAKYFLMSCTSFVNYLKSKM